MPSPRGVPDWIESRTGAAPLLLLAPHGGRRSAACHPGRPKVNDLHTAELTRELAAACDATSIINATRDRNELDLNRVIQVCAHARWLLDALADLLEAMLDRSPRATVMIVHGWNVVQPACDVGVGLVERDGRYDPAADGHATASNAFLAATVRPLQRLAARAAIAVTVGARYPGAHRNNLVQLFTPARGQDSDPALRRIAALTARVDAAQLELGMPLRWPGPRRTAFVDLLTHVLAGRQSESSDAPARPVSALTCGGHVTTRRGLQFTQDGLVGLTSIDAATDGGVAGRLLVSPAPNQLALFTGELARRGEVALSVPGLEYNSTDGGGMRIRFAGPLLSFSTLTPFLDLEHGLARGHLVEAALDLRFTPANVVTSGRSAAAAFGPLEGWLVLGGARRTVRTVAQALDGSVGLPARYPFARLTLPATPLGHLALASHDASDPAPVSNSSPPGARSFHLPLAGSAWRADGAHSVTGSCDLTLGPSEGRLRLRVTAGTDEPCLFTAALERLIPVRRPGRAGAVVLTVYALCRPAAGPAGWIELSTEHAWRRPASESPAARAR